MRESDRLGSWLVREGGRLKRERRESETDMPKLYTYNEYEHSVIEMIFRVSLDMKVINFMKIEGDTR